MINKLYYKEKIKNVNRVWKFLRIIRDVIMKDKKCDTRQRAAKQRSLFASAYHLLDERII